MDARLVEHRLAESETLHQLQAIEHFLPDMVGRQRTGLLVIDQPGVVDQFGEDHRHGLQRLDLDVLVTPRIDVLHGKDADRPLAPHDRHAGEAMELFLAGFGTILELRMSGRLGEVQRFDVLRDSAGEAGADTEPGHVNRALVEAASGEQLEHPLPQKIDRADLAIERLADDVDDLVELALRGDARGHQLVELSEDRPGGGDGGQHSARLSHPRRF